MTAFLGAAPGERSASRGGYRAGYHEGGLITQTATPMPVHPPIAHVPNAMREAVIRYEWFPWASPFLSLCFRQIRMS